MKSDPSTNERFKVYYRNGWAYLVVYPQTGQQSPVYPEEVESRMRLLGVPPVRAKVIRDLIDESSGKPEPLVEWPAGRALASEITVSIAEDAMAASITVVAPKKGAAPPVLQDLLQQLNQNGVIAGIDRERIERLLARREYGKTIQVATGLEPVFGRGHRIAYHFNINRNKPYLEMDFGRINLKELNFIDNKDEGDLLAELIPPITPADGQTVTGLTIPAERDTETVQLNAGANTRLSPDKTKLYASCDGNVRIADGVILVEPVITVRNVNYETGNIHFEGSVVIEGSIADGFIVEADGDIQVGKGVGRATLTAGGNILLKTGISGNGEGSIDCGGDLFAKYIESSTVTCRGNVFVEEAIMQSKVTNFKHCILNGRRSEVIASDLVVGGSFWCKKLGNISEAVTQLSIGVEPNLLISYRSTMSNILAKQAERDKAEHQIEQIETLIKEGRVDDRVLRARSQLHLSLERLDDEVYQLKKRNSHLKERLQASRKSMVVVEEMMFKGVVITFGNLEYRVPDAGARKTILRAGTHEIQESGFNYHTRPTLVFEEAQTAEDQDQ